MVKNVEESEKFVPKSIFKQLEIKKEKESIEEESKLIVERHQISIRIPKEIRQQIIDKVKTGDKVKITYNGSDPIKLIVEVKK